MEHKQFTPTNTKRDEKERIVWQNQSHLVLNYLMYQQGNVSLLELVKITDYLALWCMNGKSQELTDSLKAIDNYYKKIKQ